MKFDKDPRNIWQLIQVFEVFPKIRNLTLSDIFADTSRAKISKVSGWYWYFEGHL